MKKVKRLDASVTKNEGLSELTVFRLNFSNALTKMEQIDQTSKIDVVKANLMYPDIVQDAAWTVPVLPSTQVSVEHLFSGLRFIKSHLCASVKEDLTGLFPEPFSF